MKQLPKNLKLNAEWTDDCQGKKDYDGDIISISTRYYPRGGGFGLIVKNQNGEIDIKHNINQDIKPHAKSSLIIYYDEDYFDIIEKEFEAETEQEVKLQVESWAQKQMDRVIKAIKNEFKLTQEEKNETTS